MKKLLKLPSFLHWKKVCWYVPCHWRSVSTGCYLECVCLLSACYLWCSGFLFVLIFQNCIAGRDIIWCCCSCCNKVSKEARKCGETHCCKFDKYAVQLLSFWNQSFYQLKSSIVFVLWLKRLFVVNRWFSPVLERDICPRCYSSLWSGRQRTCYLNPERANRDGASCLLGCWVWKFSTEVGCCLGAFASVFTMNLNNKEALLVVVVLRTGMTRQKKKKRLDGVNEWIKVGSLQFSFL